MKKKSIDFIKKVCRIKTKEKKEDNVALKTDPEIETKPDLLLEKEITLEKEKTIEPSSPVFDLLEIVTKRVEEQAFTIELSKAEIEFLELLVKNNPVIFRDVHEEIQKIIQDGKLNIHDIPDLVLLVSQMFHIHFIENCIEDFGVINIIQFIIECILDSGYLHINNLDIEILKRVAKASLSLLKMNVTIEKEMICCQGLFGFFNKK